MGQAREIIATRLPDLDERWRATVERLIDLIVEALPDPQHAHKWGRLTFTLEGNWHHWICAISRHIRLRAPEEIEAEVLAPILREAATRQVEMGT